MFITNRYESVLGSGGARCWSRDVALLWSAIFLTAGYRHLAALRPVTINNTIIQGENSAAFAVLQMVIYNSTPYFFSDP